MSNDRVVRVGDNFIVDSYSIPGLPANAYHTGDVSLDGILFLAEQWVESGVIYKVDVDPSSANYLTYAGVVNLNPGAYSSLFSTESIADFALHPKDGNLYAIGFFNEKLYRINAGTGLVTDLGNIGIALGANPNAVWFDKDGYFYFNGNSTSIYRIDITDPTSPNPVAGIFSTLAVTSEGDAARCAQAGLVLDTFDYGDFTNVTENGIQSIPAGARITDAAQIVAGAVVLPVSVPTTGSCSGKAYYYLYKLSSGVFPDTKFTLLDHTPITGDIALGYGDPKRVEMADKTSTNETIGFGHTDQNLSFLPGVTAAFLINDDIATGTRGWKERTQ